MKQISLIFEANRAIKAARKKFAKKDPCAQKSYQP